MPSSAENLKKLLRLCAAPMAGISSPIFRSLCRAEGATCAFTEMISAKGLLLGNVRTSEYLALSEDGGQEAAQIFGSDPGEMARAAAMVQAAGFSIVDINMGCPVRKVVSIGSGCALMNESGRAARIVRAVKHAVSIPVTAKIRSGWSSDRINAVQVALALEDAGLDALVVHPRTRDQGYAGQADWEVIARVRERLSIPIIGNGDVVSGAAAREMVDRTGCHGIMIGRAALGRPWIFRETAAALNGLPPPPLPGPMERYEAFLKHFRGLRSESGPTRALFKMKRFSAWYVRGLQGAPGARKALHQAATTREIINIVKKTVRTPGRS